MPHQHIMYLRKSRQDDPRETIEEVLTKHETLLQEYARREFGSPIPEENIYREIVSGESIEERREFQKVLRRIEDPNIIGVLAADVSRFSRGELVDCGRVIDDFRYSRTKAITLMTTFDLEDKYQRRFFKDELLRGNDYLEYTKEVLWRGRVAASKRGCFVIQHANYGYDRIKVGKDWTLEPNDKAEYVKLMYHWCADEGVAVREIARRLNGMNLPSPRNTLWSETVVKRILTNVVYTGRIKFNEYSWEKFKDEGEYVVRKVKQKDEDIVLVEGKHPAIIDIETFDRAQESLRRRADSTHKDHELINVFAGILRCSKCGRVLKRQPKGKAGVYYTCAKDVGGVSTTACMKSVKADRVTDAITEALEQVELPKLQEKLESGEGNAAVIQKRIIDNLTKQLAEYRQQEENQYELLETGRYTPELFDRRNKALREKMATCEQEIKKARDNMPKNVDYQERIVTLEDAISALKDPDMSAKSKNRKLKAIIDRIELTTSGTGLRTDSIHLDIRLRF